MTWASALKPFHAGAKALTYCAFNGTTKSRALTQPDAI